jgi:hypothetical protein
LIRATGPGWGGKRECAVGGGGHGRDGKLEERDLRLGGDGDHQRGQDDEGHLVEHRQAEDQADDDHGGLDKREAQAAQSSVAMARGCGKGWLNVKRLRFYWSAYPAHVKVTLAG